MLARGNVDTAGQSADGLAEKVAGKWAPSEAEVLRNPDRMGDGRIVESGFGRQRCMPGEVGYWTVRLPRDWGGLSLAAVAMLTHLLG